MGLSTTRGKTFQSLKYVLKNKLLIYLAMKHLENHQKLLEFLARPVGGTVCGVQRSLPKQ